MNLHWLWLFVHHFTDLWNDAVQYTPTIVISIVSGYFGAKVRILIDEMKLGKTGYMRTLSAKEAKEFLKGHPFQRHNYVIGIVAAFVAVVTLGESLSVMHQLVIGVLSSMAGSQFLGQRVESGNDSPYYDTLTQRLTQKFSEAAEIANKVRDVDVETVPVAAAEETTAALDSEEKSS